MKFACEKCSTKYSIADERVKGRVLKIRCKSCNHVITVREEGSQASKLPKEPAHSMEEALSDQFGPVGGGDEHTVVSQGPLPSLDDASPAAGSDDEWYVSFDGEQEGPMPLDRAVARVKDERPRGKEIHCWRPGFFVWLPLEEVPEFMKALAPPKPAVPASRPPIPSAAMRSRRVTGGQPTLQRPMTAKKDATGAQPKPSVTKDPTGPRAALAVATPRKDPTADKPLPLPPPPEAPELMGAQLTKPESKSAYRRADPTATAKSGAATRSLSDAAAKAAPVKKPLFPELKREHKKPEPVPDNVSPFAAALTANAGGAKDAPAGDAKIPDTGPTPLPPPPGEELPIGEASGLLNLSHLASVTGSQKATGQRASVETFGGQPVATPTGANGIASQPPAPVVVVAGPAPRHTAPWIKAAAIGSAVVAIALAGTLVYVLTRPPIPGTNAAEAKDKSRLLDDKPIAFAVPGDPNSVIDPVTRKRVARPAPAKTAPTPAAAAKQGDPYKGLTAEQRRMLELYGQGGDEAKVHQLPSVAGPQKRAQVNESALAAVVAQNKNSMGLCYQRSLKHDPTLKSLKMSAHVNIGISGRVTNVSFAEQQYAQAEIGQCLQQSIKRWNFPAADGEYEFEFPIVLQAN